MALATYKERVTEIMEDLRNLDPQEFWDKYDGDPILHTGMTEEEYDNLYGPKS